MRKSYEQSNIAHLYSCLVRAEGNKQRAFEILQRESPFTVKSGIGATGQSDLTGSGYDRLVNGQWVLSLDHGPLGVFDTTKGFTQRAAFHSSIYLGGGIVATIVNEGVSIPVSKYAVDSSGLTPVKAAALAVTTREASASQEGIETLERELRQEIMLATDGKFLSILAADAATVETASPDPLVDLQAMLLAVNLTGYGQLFWAVSPTVATVLSTWRGTGDQLVFPGMGPAGGELLNVPAIVTAALSDSIVLLDAAGIVTGSEDLRVDVTEQAMFEMDNSPAMNSVIPAAPSGAVISCFQADCIALLAVRSFAAKLIRESAVAVLESIAWDGMPTTTSTTQGA